MAALRIHRVIVGYVVVGFLLAGVGLASLVALRHYRGARSSLESDPPSPLLKNPAAANLNDLQRVQFVARGLTLAGWYIAAKNRAAVVVVHGTNGDRTTMLTEIRLLSAAGFGVLAFDWPGLGESQGTVRWGAEARDSLRAAIDWLAVRPDIDAHRIGALGFSIGGMLLAQVAADDRRIQAVVLESPPTDFNAYVRFHNEKWGYLALWPARWALRDSDLLSIDNSSLTHIAEISPRPLFIIAQTGDPDVPASMARQLDEAARAPKQLWLISGASHGGYATVAGVEYEHRLRAFFMDNLLGTEPHEGANMGETH